MKKTKKTKDIRGFHWSSKAWYNIDPKNPYKDIIFGIYNEKDGSTLGEMKMDWEDLGQTKLIPRLKCYCGGWKILSSFTDVLQELAKVDDKHISEEEFVEILKKCGFEDLTAYKRK